MAGEKRTDPAWVKKVLATEAEIDRVCENARSQIFDRVRRHMERHPNDGLSGKPLVQLEEALKALYKASGKKILEKFRDSLPEVMREAYDEAAKITRHAPRGVIGKVDEKRIKQTLSGAYEQIAGRTSQMSFEHIQKLRALSAEVFRTATLTGATRKEVTKQLISKATEIQGFQFVDNSGRIWKNKAYFEMLARTELMNAGREAYNEECANNGYDIVQLSFSGNSCPSCTKWEGKIFSLTGVTKGIPTKEDLEADGVFHPNCTHTYTAVSDFELEEMGLDIRQPYAETAAERRDSVDNIDDDSGKNVQIEVPQKDAETIAYEKKREEMAKQCYEAIPVKPSHKEYPEYKRVADTMVAQYTREAAKLGDPPKLEFVRGGLSCMIDSKNKICIGGKGVKDAYTKAWVRSDGCIRHEFEHWVHKRYIERHPDFVKEIEKAVESDWNGIKERYRENMKPLVGQMSAAGEFSNRVWGKIFSWEPEFVEKRHCAAGFADCVGEMSQGVFGGGHDRSYYKRKYEDGGSNRYCETIANVRSMVGEAGEEAVAHDFPEVLKIVKKMGVL